MNLAKGLVLAIVALIIISAVPSLPVASSQGPATVAVLYVPLRNLNLAFLYAEASAAPGNPLYGHLMNSTLLSQVLPPPSQVSGNASLLQGMGFRVLGVLEGSMILFEARLGQLEEDFGGQARYFSYMGREYFVYSSYVPGVGYVYASNFTLQPLGLTSGLQGVGPGELREAYGVGNMTGSGVPVGIVTYYGDPLLGDELEAFDTAYGLPGAPVSYVPIGPYDPNLGLYAGWAAEAEALAEAVHSMAPGSPIVIYAAWQGLPLSAMAAEADQLNSTPIVLIPFGAPEGLVNYLGYGFYLFNFYLADVYFALGAAEGITFVAPTGDNGSIYPYGPLGSLYYPASSPWVLAVGGSTSFVSGNLTAQSSWSAEGDVGSQAGVSAVEPMPWWQGLLRQQPPQGFPYGRGSPDVVADASPATGLSVITSSGRGSAWGNGLAAAVVAGELADVEGYVGHGLGLIAPTLYLMYRGTPCNASTRSAFEQAYPGYSFPWLAGRGYSVLNGLGAVNASRLARWLAGESLLRAINCTVPRLLVSASLSPQGPELLPGQRLSVVASVTYYNETVSSGFVNLYIETAQQGVVEVVPMSYSAGLWRASVTVPANASGPAMIAVEARYNGTWGIYEYEAFIGYFVDDLNLSPGPHVGPLGMSYEVVELNGTPVNVPTLFEVLYYCYENNTYALEEVTSGTPIEVRPPGYYIVEAQPPAFAAIPLASGPLVAVSYSPEAAWGYSPSPGSCLYFTVSLAAPAEAGPETSAMLEHGSNVTVYLASNSSGLVSTFYQAYVYYNTTLGEYWGCVRLPSYVGQGYYAVIVETNYSSAELGPVEGVAYGYVYVSPPLRATITAPAYSMMGQPITVYANVTYPNGTPVRLGYFTLSVRPASGGPSASLPMQFNSTLGLWEATITLPWSNGSLEGVSARQPQAWDIEVYGQGVYSQLAPLETQVIEMPVYYYFNRTLAAGQFYPTDSYFEDVNLTFSGALYNDVFAGTDYIVDSNVTILYSSSYGDLVIVDSNVTLAYSRLGRVVLVNSSLTLLWSNVSGLAEGPGSRVTVVVPAYVREAVGYLQSLMAEYLSQAMNNLSLVREELLGDLGSLSYELSGVRFNVSLLQGQLYQAMENLTAAWQYLRGLRANVTALGYAVNASLAYAKAMLQEANSAVSQAGYVVSEFRSLASQVRSNVTAEAELVNALWSNVSSLGEALSRAETNITLLRQNVTQLASYQGVEASRLSSWISGNYTALHSQLTQLSSSVSAQGSRLSSQASSLARATAVAVAGLALAIAALALALLQFMPRRPRRAPKA
ncbi:hypothetical protein [Acidilobus sp.]|uniref:hypothetical protein n=1 Tax=Acidilobus sp. TaxID=1872109 RepID=UPI003D023073